MKKIIIIVISFVVYYNFSNAQQFTNIINSTFVNTRCVTVDNLGEIWVASSTNGITKYNGGNPVNYNTTNSGLANNACWAIETDVLNNKWIGTNGGLYKLDANSGLITNIPIPGISPLIRSLYIDNAANEIWVGTSPGANPTSALVKINMNNNAIITTYTTVGNNINPNVRCIEKLSNGNICCGMAYLNATTQSGGFAVYNTSNNSFLVYNTNVGILPSNNIYALKKDNLGNMWIGTNAGISVYNGSFTSFNVSNGLIDSNIKSIVQDANNNLWFCSSTGGISKFNPANSSFDGYNINNGLCSNSVFGVATGNSNKKYFGTISGLSILEENIIKVIPSISLSSSYLVAGDILALNGDNFSVSNSAKILIKDKQNNIILNNTTSINAAGKFTNSFSITPNLQDGLYTAIITDNNTNTSINKNFYINNVTPLLKNIKIIEPDIYTFYSANNPIEIRWTDKGKGNFNNINSSGYGTKSYKIEYIFNNGSPTLIANLNNLNATPFVENEYTYSFNPIVDGQYSIQVSEIGNAINVELSPTFTINSFLSNHYTIERKWDFSGNIPLSVKPKGVAADGISRFYFKVSPLANTTYSIASVALNIVDNNNSLQTPELIGKVTIATNTNSYSLEANNIYSTNITNYIPDANGDFWFWYVAPDNFMRDSVKDYMSSKRIINANFTVSYNGISSQETSTENIQIVRPPLMLMHGINGSEHTWDNGKFEVGNILYNMKQFPYQNSVQKYANVLPNGSFDDNAKLLLNMGAYNSITNMHPSSFQVQLKTMRDKGYACNRIDYVCHSMGGCMARTVINKYPNEYIPNLTSNKVFKNYDSGYINKLITVNTPHNGSPFAEYISEVIPNLNLLRVIMLNKIYESGAVFNFINKNYGNNNSYSFIPSPAIENMQMLNDGIRFKQTNVRNHLIAGNCAINKASFETYGDYSKHLIGPIFSDAFGVNFENYSKSKGISNFFGFSDMIVPLESQFAGKNLNNLSTENTLNLGLQHMHITTTDQVIVGNRILQLLNEPNNSILFSNFIPANITPNGIQFKKSRSIDSTIEYIDTLKIITNSLAFNSIQTDTFIDVVVKIKDTINLKSIDLTFQGQIFTTNKFYDSIIFRLPVNSIFIDSQQIVIGALFDSVGFKIYHYNELKVVVNPIDSVYKIKTDFETKNLTVGEYYVPELTAIFNKNSAKLFMKNVEVNYIIGNNNIIQYNALNNQFLALDSGSTFISFTYRGKSDTMFFNVSKATNLSAPLAIESADLSTNFTSCKSLLSIDLSSSLSISNLIIQRSNNNTNFENIKIITPIADKLTYTYADETPLQNKNYYRIKITNTNGSVSFSNISIVTNNCSNSDWLIAPNPAITDITITANQIGKFIKQCKIVDATGKIVKIIEFPNDKSKNINLKIDINNLQTGIYNCELVFTNGMSESKLFEVIK